MKWLHRPVNQALLLSAAVFILYSLGACRTIYVGDSGELVAAAATLGIPHPAGYPLYVLLGKLWITLLPVGSVAFRMSLFSAGFGAAACGLLFWTCRRQNLSALTSLIASLCLAFAPSFWSQATIQRVYTLNGFFVIALLACALEWARTRRFFWMIVAAFVAGLGASNHTVMGVLGLSVGLFAVITEPAILKRPRQIGACIAAGLAGLTPYLYLPLRSRQDPRLDWGNPETLDSLIAVITRRDFWHRAWMESPSDWLPISTDYLSGLGTEFLGVGALLAIYGLITSRTQSRPWMLPIAILLANFLVVALHGSRSDIFIWHRYYIPSFAMVALLIAWGVQRIHDRWGLKTWSLLILPLGMLVSGWQSFDRSDFVIAEEFSRQLLDSLPPGAHLAASDDNILFVLIYLHLVEGVRPDVHLIMQGVGGIDLGTLRFDPDDNPVYFTHHPNWEIEGLEMRPVGLVFRTSRTNSEEVDLQLPEIPLPGAWDPEVPKDYLAKNLIGHYHYMLGVTHERRDWPRARVEFERAALAASTNDVLLYNQGLIYRRNGLIFRSLDAFEKAAAINPRHIPSNQPARPTERVEETRKEASRIKKLEVSLAQDHGIDISERSASTYRKLARILEDRGESLRAHGLRLLALELEAQTTAVETTNPVLVDTPTGES